MNTAAGIILIVSAARLFAADALPFDCDRQALTVGGITFRKSYDEAGHRWTFRALRGGRVLRTFGNPESNELDLPEHGQHLSIGTVSAVAGYATQVVIRLWTGGKNCCNAYWITGFTPELRVLLDTSAYRFDDRQVARDIDGDRDLGFSFGTTTFNYFAAGYAYSPRVQAWFKFDRVSTRFVPANDVCLAEVEKQVRTDQAKLRRYSKKASAAPDNQEFREMVLDVVLAPIRRQRGRRVELLWPRVPRIGCRRSEGKP